MSKKNTLFILVVFLALIIRLYNLNDNPPGLYSDEAAYIYNAYSILETGRDEYGNFLPVAFRSFGDYKAPLYIYLTAPFVGIFGLKAFSVRIFSVVLGILTLAVLYQLAKYLYNSKTALLSSFFFSVMPLALQFNRMGHEGSLSVLIVLSGLLLYLKAKTVFGYLFSFFFFALSLYAYHDARIFTPLLLFFLVIRSMVIHKKRLSAILPGILLFLFMLLPLITNIRNPDFWSRPFNTGFMTDRAVRAEIEAERSEDFIYGGHLSSIMHNRPFYFFLKFLENFGRHLSADFLFFSGDPVPIYATVGNGILLLSVAPLLLVGFAGLFSNKPGNKLLLAAFSFSLAAASLTRFVPSASRIMIASPFLALIITRGLKIIIEQFKQVNNKWIFIVFFSVVLSLNLSYYLHQYHANTRVRYAREWHYGMEKVYAEIYKRQSQYETIWLSRNAWGYIYALVFLKIPPESYQPQAKLSELNEYGFGWVPGFDKYVFSEFPTDLTKRDSTLFIGQPADFWGKLGRPLYTVNYPDGQPAFYFADASSFKN